MKVLNILLVALVMTIANDAFAQRGEKTEKETKTVRNEQSTQPPSRGEMADDDAAIKTLTSADQAKEIAEAKTRELSDKVGGLSADQRKEVYKIFEGTYMSIRDYKQANPEMEGPALREKGRAMIADGKNKAYKVLTPEQQEMVGRKADKSNKDKSMQRAQQQTDELDKVVGLTAEQRKEVVALNTSIWEEMKAWKAANPEVQGEEKRAYGKEMQKKRLQGYKDILNAEQVEKFIAHRDSNGNK